MFIKCVYEWVVLQEEVCVKNELYPGSEDLQGTGQTQSDREEQNSLAVGEGTERKNLSQTCKSLGGGTQEETSHKVLWRKEGEANNCIKQV